MFNRRSFIERLSALSAISLISSTCKASKFHQRSKQPFFIATWNNHNAIQTALKAIKSDPNDLLSAIEKGINYAESDPNDTSVGYGGKPDSDGNVTLDACIMNHKGEAGAVTYLKNIMHPISVARKVMEHTPHVTLSGEGAFKFALEHGFESENLLTDNSRKSYEKWLEKSEFSPKINSERHDTIGMLGMDEEFRICGGCSTSGLAFKKPGRVGDSPVIGAGLYLDNEIGASTATGFGELVLEHCSTFLVVELMRQGLSPENACKEALSRIIRKPDTGKAQVGLIAINKKGEYGGYAIQKGFQYLISNFSESKLIDAKSYFS